MPVQGDLDIRVRYSECDPMGYAHHAAYPVWLEMGRTELLRSRGLSYRELESRGVFIVVVKLEVNYRRPAKYDDLLRLRTTAARVTRVKLEHQYHLFRRPQPGSAHGEELLTTAATTLACVDRDGRVIEVPEFLREPAAT